MAERLDPERALARRHPTDRHGPTLISHVPLTCSLLAALVALSVLAGWSARAYALVTVLPRLPAMAQSTACAFLLASASLWLLSRSVPGGRSHRAGRALGLAALLVGLATLAHYGWLLVGLGDLPTDGAGRPINHMSPNSAIDFVLLGLALFLADTGGRGGRWPAQALALVVALDALVALVGQICGVTFLYGLSPYLGMALHTATLFLLLSVGLLLARPGRGFVAVLLADDAAGRAARRFLPLALVAPVVLGGVGLLAQRLHRPDAPLLAYLLVVASVGLLGWLVWGNVLALSEQVRRSQASERQVAELERARVEDALAASEQRLVYSEQRLAFAVEGAGIGTWAWDIAADRLVWSDVCKALFGLPPETQMTRALFYERIHPDDRQNAEATIARALAEGVPYDIEYRVVWPDGAVRWVAAKGRGYQDAAGHPVRFEGTVQDVDESRRAEEGRRRFLRDVLASVTEGRLILCDAEADLPRPLPAVGGDVPLSREGGLRELRERALEAAQGMALERQHDLLTAVGEASMNAVVHGGGGTGRVSVGADGAVQVRVEDQGAGIAMEDLPRATLVRGYSTKATLGHGIKMMIETCDRLYLLTGASGTTVVLVQGRDRPPPTWL